MPLNKKGKKIMKSMKEQYGSKKGKSIFYATMNKGKIKGVEKKAEGGVFRKESSATPPVKGPASQGINVPAKGNLDVLGASKRAMGEINKNMQQNFMNRLQGGNFRDMVSIFRAIKGQGTLPGGNTFKERNLEGFSKMKSGGMMKKKPYEKFKDTTKKEYEDKKKLFPMMSQDEFDIRFENNPDFFESGVSRAYTGGLMSKKNKRIKELEEELGINTKPTKPAPETESPTPPKKEPISKGMKFGGSVTVKTKLGRNKPTKIC